MTFSDFDEATAPTAPLDRLAAVLPGAVDEAMRKALPDVHTPMKAKELADDIFPPPPPVVHRQGHGGDAVTVSATKPSVDHLMDTPLPVLINELGVTLTDSPITDQAFFGAVIVQRKTGELRLTMPTGRSELEHDTVARYLLAQALEVPVPGMPAPFVTTRIPAKQTEVTL
ncbi:hypothetical protein AB0F77_20990 [Streptomyces sp. NPDC026672]|uniref:hypothetical protein n=1 Tax=unclassified Streptomyces TaxID=2593676 RepID=UPI0033DAD675